MTRTGVSSLRLFFIDDVPTTARADNNATPKNAQPLTLPAAVEADAQPLTSHYYRFAAKKGQRIGIEVIAQRMNSRTDPVVRLMDASGRELAYCDDTPGLGADPRFGHTFTTDGEYLVEIRDANYDGGVEYRYRLRIGDFPAVTAPFPLAGKRGAETTFTFEGPGGDRLDPVAIAVKTAAPDRQIVAIKNPGGRTSAFVPVGVDDAEDFVATKPNHSQATAAPITLPVNISGRIVEPGVHDFYRVTCKKGDRLSLRARTRSVGSPAMLSLQILKTDGKRLAESKFAVPEPKGGDATPIPDEEGSLDFTIPSDGQYDIVAQDFTRAAGPAAVYRLEVQTARPDFSLSVDTEKLDGAAGSTARLTVKATRRDFDGPITLALTGDAATFDLKNATIAKGKLETDLEITLPKTVPAAQPLTFTVEGRASAGDREIVHTASTAAALKKLFPRLVDPPLEFDGLIGVGIHPAEKPATQPATTRTTAAH
jgi:hypothetical protein